MRGRAPLRAENHLTGFKSKPATTSQAAGLAFAGGRCRAGLGKGSLPSRAAVVTGLRPAASRIDCGLSTVFPMAWPFGYDYQSISLLVRAVYRSDRQVTNSYGLAGKCRPF